MGSVPMLGDIASRAEPDAVVTADMFQEPDQPGRLARSPDQAIVQADAHQLRCLRSLRVEKIERVDHVAGEIVRTTEAGIAIEPVVVGLERIGNDEMAAASDLHPIGELVVESVAVIEEAAGLHQKFAGVLAWPSVEPTDRRTAGKLANAFDREPDVLALGCLVHVV